MKVFHRKKRLAVGVLAASTLAAVLGMAPAANAATWNVKCDEDKLIQAIEAANANGTSDVISLAKNCKYEFDWAAGGVDDDGGKSATPVIEDDAGGIDLVIKGNGAKLVRDDDGQDIRLLTLGADSTVRIENLTVTGGYVTDPDGGGIHMREGSSLTGINLKVLDNEVFSVSETPPDPDESFGGGINCDDCAVLALSNSTIADNTASTLHLAAGGAEAVGGGIAADSGADVTLLKSSVKGNDAIARSVTTALAQGGGIAVTEVDFLHLDRTKVTKNLAESRASDAVAQGGGVYAFGTGDVDILDSEVSGNTASGQGDVRSLGGGMYLEESDTFMVESKVTKNTVRTTGGGSQAWGGGINQAGGELDVDPDGEETSEISGNKAIAEGFASGARGAGYHAENGAVATFTGTEFEGNKATAADGVARGGGLYIGNSVPDGGVVLDQAEVEENEASGLVEDGGGIFAEESGDVELDLSEISDNEPNDCDSLDNGEFC
jgi:hypothetical protein